MMFVVYQKMTPDCYPVMVAVFLMKCDAKSFIDKHTSPHWFSVEEVADTYQHWYKIREKLNEQVYRDENEEC